MGQTNGEEEEESGRRRLFRQVGPVDVSVVLRSNNSQPHVLTTLLDYGQNARKVYKRQLQTLPPDLEAYAKQKLKVVKDGQVFETTTGELVAVDENGDFFADT